VKFGAPLRRYFGRIHIEARLTIPSLDAVRSSGVDSDHIRPIFETFPINDLTSDDTIDREVRSGGYAFLREDGSLSMELHDRPLKSISRGLQLSPAVGRLRPSVSSDSGPQPRFQIATIARSRRRPAGPWACRTDRRVGARASTGGPAPNVNAELHRLRPIWFRPTQGGRIPNSLRLSSWFWHHEYMAKLALTIELDEDVILAARAEASRKGQSEAAVVERALREHLAHQGSVTDEVWERNRDAALGEEEALTLAYGEAFPAPGPGSEIAQSSVRDAEAGNSNPPFPTTG
jgi:hypothetical protein